MVWSKYVFMAVLILSIILFFLPNVIFRRSRRELSFFHRGMCVLLAWVMFISPEMFNQLSESAIAYSEINVSSWGKANREIIYEYDDNGSVTQKVTNDDWDGDIEIIDYIYDLANRLVKVITEDGFTGNNHIVEYEYNDEGIRVKSHSYDILWNENIDNEKTAVYLIDSYNHTGYSQTLEEETETIDYINGVPQTPVTQVRTYLIGDDVIAQKTNGNTQYLLYDGHGSTRQLAFYSGGSVYLGQNFSYDGYGVLLQPESFASADPGYTPQQATNLLYAGEHFDFNAQQYYNRARWYNPLNGLFNRVDPYSGNTRDPQSLHKYLYCHANPVNGVDPSGRFFDAVSAISAVSIQCLMGGIMAGTATNAYLRTKSNLASGEGIFQYLIDTFFSKLLDWAFFGTRQTYNWVFPFPPIPGSQFTVSAGIEGDFWHPFTSDGSSASGAMIRIYASGGIHVFGSVPPGFTPRLKNWTRPASLAILAEKWFMPGMALRVPFRHGLQGTELGDYLTGEIGVVVSAGWSSLSLGYKHLWSLTDGTRRWEAGFGVGQGSGIAVEIGLVLKLPY